MTKLSQSVLADTSINDSFVQKLTSDALFGADDGELFIENRQTEGLVWDNGRLKTANYDSAQGFGIRAVAGEAAGYAHSGELTEHALKRAADAIQTVKSGQKSHYSVAPMRTNQRLYDDISPLQGSSLEEKVKLLAEIDQYARKKDNKIKQVSISLISNFQQIEILRADGFQVQDFRPLVRFNISIVVENEGQNETGSFGCGGRDDTEQFISRENWQYGVDEALRQALVNLEAAPAPAGEFDVVLGSGWPGILLHEAVGHGLEGDFNRKKTSAFADLMGQQVAAKGVTVVDDGTIEKRRGSLTVDDEGTPTKRTVLIENGILVGYMHDRQNARLMEMEPTGNGRRESFAHIPMPRMTNTIMESGDCEPEEIISSVQNGIYAVSFGGGQVDITSGKFVFSCTEAYQIEDGKIGRPLKGAMLIGNGPDALTRISMIGNDMSLDTGIGTCGKNGQGVPVGVGQPTIRINQLTVGGTAI